jgi:ribosomal peptide maturation radical SAM protein 1
MRVSLISMPFGPLHFPSIALAQLQAVLRETMGDRVQCNVNYLCHDFGALVGQSTYRSISENETTGDTHFGDWFFRKAAFPNLVDNPEHWFQLVPTELREGIILRYERDWSPFREQIPRWIEDMIRAYKLDEADVVGFSSMFAQTLASVAMANAIRLRNPKVILVIGGANCEFPMGIEYVHHFSCFDAVFAGPALVSFPDFIQFLLDGNTESIHRIDGVFTRRNTQSAASLPESTNLRGNERVLILNDIREAGLERPIDQLLLPDYDEFLDRYDRLFSREIQEPFVVFETSRGCWWGQQSHCTFCGLNGLGMNYRSMNPESAFKLLDDLMDRYRHRVSHFECVDNILPRSFCSKVFPWLNPPEDVAFYWEVKANLGHAELTALAQAQVWAIQPGIEALNTETLKLMKKGVSAFANLRLLRDAPMYDIEVQWYLLAGFPGEEEAVYQKYLEDFPRLHHLRPPVTLIPLKYNRYSPYHLEPECYGLDLVPAHFYEVAYPIPKRALANMAYFFLDQNTLKQAINPEDALFSSMDLTLRLPLRDYWEALRQKWFKWRTRFEGTDGAPPASLNYRPGSTSVIFDTRSGQRRRHSLSPLEAELLWHLQKPASIQQLLKRFKEHLESDVLGALDVLHHFLQLTFREGDRYQSLVSAKRSMEIPEPLPRSQRPTATVSHD